MRWIGRIGVLLVGLAVGSLSLAQTPTPQPGITSEQAALVKELKTAQQLLLQANHDYEGHRAQAAAEVHKAIRELVGKYHVKSRHKAAVVTSPVVKNPAAKQPAVHEAQVDSDVQMRQAQAILQGVQTAVNTHHPKTALHVTAAISEITTALKVK